MSKHRAIHAGHAWACLIYVIGYPILYHLTTYWGVFDFLWQEYTVWELVRTPRVPQHLHPEQGLSVALWKKQNWGWLWAIAIVVAPVAIVHQGVEKLFKSAPLASKARPDIVLYAWIGMVAAIALADTVADTAFEYHEHAFSLLELLRYTPWIGCTRTVGLVFIAWLAARHAARLYEPEEPDGDEEDTDNTDPPQPKEEDQ